MNRWCIIANPRSGSTFLEYSIWQVIKPINMSGQYQPLNEIIHPDVDRFSSYILTNDGYIVVKPKDLPTDEIPRSRRSMFVQKRLSMIRLVRPKLPMILRIFCQPQFLNKEDYLHFLNGLREEGFRFICLRRNTFDRVISMYFMQETGLVARIKNSSGIDINEITVSPRGNSPFDPKASSGPIAIDQHVFSCMYETALAEDTMQEQICQTLECMTVHYESMIEDCKMQEIPMVPSDFIKTYDRSYREMVSNYDLLVQSAKNINDARKGL